MLTGWNQIDDDWYYFNQKGYMLRNQWMGDYYFGPRGAMATNQWIGDYYVGADGKWIPNYQ